MEWTAVVLAGGRARRLEGADKAELRIGGERLLDLVLDGLPGDVPVLLVGPARPTRRAVDVVTEEVPFGGPVSAFAAGLAHVATPAVVLLAVDLPRSSPLAPGLAGALAADPDVDAVVPVDAAGIRQSLAAAYRTAPVRGALARLGDPVGRSMRDLLGGLRVREVTVPDDDVADIDTPEDLQRLRAPRER